MPLAVAVAVLLGGPALLGCGQAAQETNAAGEAAAHSHGGTPTVTFIELGADKCVPCKEMQPVMRGIEQSFGDQVEVVFYDVWEDDAPARQYGVSMIPTQVFLDADGNEFHRHVGFYPQADIEELLMEQGLTRITTQ
jgi:thioredoxin 1